MPRCVTPSSPASPGLPPVIVVRHRLAHRLALALAVASTVFSAGGAFAQAIDSTLWVTNGDVNAIVCAGGTIYLGGLFSRVGPATGGGVPLDATSGALPPSFPKVAGGVRAVVSDGVGGWYIGGEFTAVGGLPRANLAHVASDLSVSAWNPYVEYGPVYALAVSGSTIYAGGTFQSIDWQSRSNTAAFDVTTGALTDWNPGANGYVGTLVVNGSTVYAGGGFTTSAGRSATTLPPSMPPWGRPPPGTRPRTALRLVWW